MMMAIKKKAWISDVIREMYLFNLKIIGPSFNFSKEIYSVKTELEFLLLDLRGRLLTCFK